MLQKLTRSVTVEALEACLTPADILELQQLCSRVQVETSVQQYILNLVRTTRDHQEIALGVSPRGAIALHRATQALAFLYGRDYALPDDVKFLAPYVLAHRIIPVGGRRAKTIIEQLLHSVPVP
jgi:MoxR-like ATPase